MASSRSCLVKAQEKHRASLQLSAPRLFVTTLFAEDGVCRSSLSSNKLFSSLRQAYCSICSSGFQVNCVFFLSASSAMLSRKLNFDHQWCVNLIRRFNPSSTQNRSQCWWQKSQVFVWLSVTALVDLDWAFASLEPGVTVTHCEFLCVARFLQVWWWAVSFLGG